MILTGIGDEAGDTLETQVRATQELGWLTIEARNVTVPGHPKANLHDLPDDAFDLAVEQLETRGVTGYCSARRSCRTSSKTLQNPPFELTLAEVKRAIPRMQRLGTKLVRIMSFKPGDDEFRIPSEVFARVREVTQRFLDAGLQPVHENCMNYGGMSPQHARSSCWTRCPV